MRLLTFQFQKMSGGDTERPHMEGATPRESTSTINMAGDRAPGANASVF